MTNRKRFFYNGILLTLVGLAMRSVGMLFGAIISRAVGAEGVGLYTLIMTVYSFAITLATSGIGLTVTRLVAAALGEEGASGVVRVMRGAFVYSLLFGCFAFVLLFFGAELIGGFILHDPRTVDAFKILSLSLPPMAVSAALCGYFVGVRRVASNAAVQVLSNVFKILVIILLLYHRPAESVGDSVYSICLGITLTELVSFLVLLVQYLILRVRARSEGIRLREVSKTALPLAFSAYVRSALLTTEHIQIPKALERGGEDSESALASYGTLHGMALPVVTFPMQPLSSFSGLLVPEFAESSAINDERRMKRICTEALSATLSYAIAVACLLSLFSEELGYVIYDSYDAGRYIAILSAVVPIMYLDHVTDAVLKGIGEQVYSMWVNIADSALSVVLVCVLIPKMGIMGYAVTIIIMELFNFVLSFSRLRKRIRFGMPKLKELLAPMISAVAASHLTRELFIMTGAASGVLWLLLKIIFALCVFIGVNTILKMLIFSFGTKTKKEQM